MRVAVDGRQLTRPSSGFKTYTRNLITGLAQVDADNEYLVYLDQPLADPPWGDQHNFQAVLLPKAVGGFFWKQGQVPLDAVLRKTGVNVFHFLCNSPSFTCPGELVYTIHDLSFKRFPDKVRRRHYLSLSLQMPLGAVRAARIITESHSAKKDICRYFGIGPDKVEVIPAGVSESFQPMRGQERLRDVRQRYGLPKRFIVYVGSFLPHKNLPTLLQAYGCLPQSLREEFGLVCAGHKDRNFSDVSQVAHDLGLDDRVMFLGGVPDKDLPALYNLADLFVFPSLYEGFGLPVLEALACGVPVVAANSSSIPEVAGEAGLLVSPKGAGEWCRAMERVLTDAELRSEMIKRGLARASLFSWEETARRTLEVYQEVGQR